jgi:hypothetical protein
LKGVLEGVNGVARKKVLRRNLKLFPSLGISCRLRERRLQNNLLEIESNRDANLYRVLCVEVRKLFDIKRWHAQR